MSTKVLIADDHPFTRAGISSILERNSSLHIVGQAKDGRDAIEQVREKEPDIVIMDITMPQLSGIEATKEIMALQPGIKVIALSIHSGQKFVKQMLDAGAVGYLLKDEAPEELLKCIDKVIQGNMFLSSVITRAALMTEDIEGETLKVNILASKLHRPPVMVDDVIRTKIIQELESNVVRPLTIVSAGAGYGKSVTVSQWLEQTKYLNAWISLDEEHNDVRTFLGYIVAAIEKVEPGVLLKTFDLTAATILPAINEVASILINDLCDIEDEIILVLDDYHKIHEQKIHDLLDAWLVFPPPNIHLCIVTRRDPPLKVRSLKYAGRITEIRMEELSFSDSEIVELFKHVRNINLSEEAVKLIHDKTEGWIISLRLASMVIESLEELNNFISEFEGGLNTLSDYLITEVLTQLPEDSRNLLLVSSIMDRFCSELIDELHDVFNSQQTQATPGISGKEFIMWLLKSNLFIIDLDNEGTWFRYHHLFQQMLQNQLNKQLSENKIKELHKAASEWFEANDYLFEAMDHAIEMEDIQYAAGILRRNRLKMLNNNNYFQLEQLQRRIPLTVVESDPELLLAELYLQWNHGDFTRLGELEEMYKILIKDVDKKSTLHSESLFFIGFNSLFLRGDLAAALEYFDEAMDSVPESPAEPRGVLELHYMIFGQLAGLYDKLHTMFRDLITKDLAPLRKNRVYQGFLAASINQANTFEIEKNIWDGIAYAKETKMKDAQGIMSYMVGSTYLRIGKTEKATEILNHVLENRFHVHSRVTTDSLIGIIILKTLNKEFDKAEETLAILEEYIEPIKEFFAPMIWSARARHQMILGNHNEVKELLKVYEPGILDLVIWIDIPEITHARALLVEGSWESLDKAEAELATLEATTGALSNRIHLYEVKVLQAILFNLKSDNQKAEEALSASIAIAEPEGLVAYFFELGKMFVSLVDSMPEKISTRPFIVKIIDQIKQSPEKQIKEKPSADAKLNLLTRREMEILEGVAEGLRNKEIADKLSNSEETIKRHIYNMFQKLHAKNRMNLVSLAKQKGIID